MISKYRHFLYAAPAALALLVAAAPMAAAQDPVPIGPNEFFVGAINGTTSVTAEPIIKMVCPVAAAYGHPIAGQTVEVRLVQPVSTTDGYTGSLAHSVLAEFVDSPPGLVNPPVKLTSYYAPVAIPTTLTLPCSGHGTVVFDPNPWSPSAHAYTLPVLYANIAS